MLADITYIGDRDVDAQLGCPTATHGCFYSFTDDAGATLSHTTLDSLFIPHQLCAATVDFRA